MKNMREKIVAAFQNISADRAVRSEASQPAGEEQGRQAASAAEAQANRTTLVWHPSLGASVALLAVLILSPVVGAQSGPSSQPVSVRSEGTIVRYVWEAATPLPEGSGDAVDPRLSRNFTTSGLGAASMLREWQRHLAYTLRSGYPLSEPWIARDRDRADAALQLAAVAASNQADRIALRSLVREFETLRQWSEELIEANRNLRLGAYYTSPEALNNDPLFQKSRDCGNFLTAMLTSGQVAEDRSCQ